MARKIVLPPPMPNITVSTIQFQRELDKLLRAAGKNQQVIVKKVSLELLAAIKQDTPVDTGNLRAGFSLIDQSDQRSGVKLRTRIGSRLTQAAQKFAIENNEDYVLYVEYGTSKMRAFAMVRKNLYRFMQSMRRHAAELIGKKKASTF